MSVLILSVNLGPLASSNEEESALFEVNWSEVGVKDPLGKK